VHEYSVASALLQLVEAQLHENRATRAVRVVVRLGEQSGVEHELLRSAWELVRERSPAAGARLDLVSVPVRWACRACEKPLAPGGASPCPECGGAPRLAAGDELILDRIEMEVD
jgi:hydrogenase nickel incorporation protein HypA/HybF